jgi:hypothetical protein
MSYWSAVVSCVQYWNYFSCCLLSMPLSLILWKLDAKAVKMSDSEDWKPRKDYLLKNYPVEAFFLLMHYQKC